MKIPRLTLRAATLVLCVVGGSLQLHAQGVTTGAISGAVRDAANVPIENATITIVNRSNGRTSMGRTRADGFYLVQGLEVGGPYSVTVRRLGSASQTKDNIFAALGQQSRVDFTMAAAAAQLSGVTVTASAEGGTISRSHTGIGTQISDSTIRRMASANRDFADFAALTPQVATSGNGTGNGISAAGMNTRFNTIQIDGANSTDLYAIASGNNSEPGSAAGAKSISIEAVKEYQVLLSPFDVRQGNFAGLLLNAVTKSGTNDLRGSAYYYLKNHGIERTAFLNGTQIGKFDQRQYGFTLGGPIIRNRAFFFVAPEFQAQQSPSTGPYVGSSDSPVGQLMIDSVNKALLGYGIAGGTGDAVPKTQPNSNIFARFDVNLTASTRLVARYNYVDAKRTSFSRSVGTGTSPSFALTSNQYATTNKTSSPVLQLLSNFSNGIYNELMYSRTDILDFRTVPLVSPQVTVSVPNEFSKTLVNPNTNNTAKIVAGQESSSAGNRLSQTTTEWTDNITLPFRNHSFTVGGKAQFYHPNNLFANNFRGTWVFLSADSLMNGIASSYSASVPVGNTAANGGAGVADARTFSGYFQDQWQATRNLAITAGLRLDVPWFSQRPDSNPAVSIEFPGRTTTYAPNKQKQWAPRVGFNWDATGDQMNQVRGGVGVFTGSPPYVFLINAFLNTGVYGFAGVSCTGTTATTRPPVFNAASIATPPSTCGTAGAAPALAANAQINLINPNFRFPSSYKMSFGYDHRFENSRWSFLDGSVGTVEALYTHAINAPFYYNMALAGPQGKDRYGRVMYGTVAANGTTPVFNGATARTGVYDVSNSNKDYSYTLTGQMQKRFTRAFEGSLAYTYSQARDVQSIINSTAASAFNQGRNVKGVLTDQNLGRSHWEQPHRLIAHGTYTLMKTDISVIYMGGNGSAYDYTYTGGTTPLGDANGDGRSGNDLVYVPKDVRNPQEILFTGYNVPTSAVSVQQQQDAFDRFINETPCLRNQRGRIMDRDSCRAPWINVTNVALRHSIPTVRGQNGSIQLEIFNFANLLNKNWGQNRQVIDGGLPGDFLLTRTAVDLTDPAGPRGVYTFATTKQKSDPNRLESVYHMQVSVRYTY